MIIINDDHVPRDHTSDEKPKKHKKQSFLQENLFQNPPYGNPSSQVMYSTLAHLLPDTDFKNQVSEEGFYKRNMFIFCHFPDFSENCFRPFWASQKSSGHVDRCILIAIAGSFFDKKSIRGQISANKSVFVSHVSEKLAKV